MLGLHIIHFLQKLIGHFTSLEDGVGESRRSCILNRLVVHHVLKRQVFEELSSFLLFFTSFLISLLLLFLFVFQELLLCLFLCQDFRCLSCNLLHLQIRIRYVSNRDRWVLRHVHGRPLLVVSMLQGWLWLTRLRLIKCVSIVVWALGLICHI